MLNLIPAYVYVFTILWIIPYYPSYRSFIRGGWKQPLACLVCSAAILSVLILVSYDHLNEMLFMVPLLIVCMYVDWRDQEIPDFPVLLMYVYGVFFPEYHHTFSMIFCCLVLFPFTWSEMLGIGDLKLMCAMALIAGWIAALGFAAGSLFCIIHHFVKKESPDTKIPFAPYLCSGFLITLLAVM